MTLTLVRYDEHEHTLEVDEENYNVTLYDTAGQEEYDNLRIVYLKNKKPDVIVLCYSIDDINSYKNVRNKWIPELKNRAPIVLVGTKSDLRKKRNHKNVSYGNGVALKRKIKAFSFVECSSKNLMKIDDVFEEAVRASIGRRSKNASDDFFSRVKIQSKKNYLFISKFFIIFNFCFST